MGQRREASGAVQTDDAPAVERVGGSRPARVTRLARQKRMLARLARSEHLASGDLPAFLRDLTRAVADVLDIERVGVWLFDEARTSIRCELLWERAPGRISAGHELETARYPRYFAALDEERVIDARYARNDPRTCELSISYLEPLGITSMLDAPIRLDGRMVGVVCHEQVGPERVWRPDEQQLVGSVSDLLGLALAVAERCKALASLRESEERYRLLVENVGDVIYTVSPDGYLTSLNRAFEQILGWRRADWIGAHFSLLLHPDDLPLAIDLQRRVLAGEAPPSFDMRIRDSDGVFHVGEFRATPERHGGRVVGITGVGRDVTERTRVEKRNRALLDVARDIAGRLDLDELLGRVVQRAAEVLPSDVVVVISEKPTAGGQVVATFGLSPDEQAGALALRFAPGKPLFQGRLCRGETVVLEHLRTFPDFAEEASCVAAPISARGQHFGAFLAVRRDGAGFDASQVELCEAIARLVSAAMGAAELYRIGQEEARAESALARIGREMISSLDAPVLLERLCRVSREVLECDLCHTFLYQPAEDDFVLSAGAGETQLPWDALRAIRIPRTSFADLVERLDADGLLLVASGLSPAMDGLMAAYGVGAGMLVAIRRGDALIGVLSVGRRDPSRAFDAVEERIVRQIAHLASLALANAELFEQLEGANRLKSQFVATMSHELRTPLHVILGYTELLLEGAFGHLALGQIETLQRIGRSADSLCELVNATLDLSRLEAGKITVDRREVDIEALVAEIARRALDGAGRPSVELVCDIEPDLDPIETDPGKLKVVLGNLLANAFKFTEQGRVVLRARRLDEGLELSVSDTGVGIPLDAQELIFESFRQGDATAARRYGGVGLGLHIVRQLLGVLGGAVSVESEPAKGSTFRVWLPARP